MPSREQQKKESERLKKRTQREYVTEVNAGAPLAELSAGGAECSTPTAAKHAKIAGFAIDDSGLPESVQGRNDLSSEEEEENEEFPVDFFLSADQLRGNIVQQDFELDGGMSTSSTPAEQGRAQTNSRGRPRKRSGRTNFGGRKARIVQPVETPLITDTPIGRGAIRQIKLREEHIKRIEDHLEKLMAEYQARPWPKKKTNVRSRQSVKKWTTCCKGGCDCKSFAQCHQNAQAYVAAATYNRKNNPVKAAPRTVEKTTKQCHRKHACASAVVNHRVDYYDSGQFGDANCEHCGALFLQSEFNAVKQGRMTPCCADGQCHTEQLSLEYAELQNPPPILNELVHSKDDRMREEFLDNTLTLNNTFAFASIQSEKAGAEQMAGRMDTVKYNGQFSFQFSDLIAPGGQSPKFAQVYTLTPEDAIQMRYERITTTLDRRIRLEIVAQLERLMRDNPFGQTFMTAGAKIDEAKQKNNGEIPHFQIVLLTDRDLQTDAFKNRPDCAVIERADAPTAQQIAVVWVQEDGLAPQVNGFWVCDKKGKMRELKSGMPQLDPCCFPILHPRGTAGWRWFLKKQKAAVQGRELTADDSGVVLMEEQLDAARTEEFEEERRSFVDDEVFDGESAEDEEMQEDENELDEDDEVEVEVENANFENGDTGHTFESDELFVRPNFPDDEGAELGAIAESVENKEQGRAEENDNNMFVQSDSVIEPEDGWKPRKQRELGVKKPGPQDNISERQFYRYRLALRENSKAAFHWLWFARRLAEYFIIAVLNRVERNEMDHLKAQQTKKNYRQIMARDYIQALEKGLERLGGNARLGRVFLMPQTFAGSRQYYQQKYADLMTIVRKLGNPTWFVTYTGNPRWPEQWKRCRGGSNTPTGPTLFVVFSWTRPLSGSGT